MQAIFNFSDLYCLVFTFIGYQTSFCLRLFVFTSRISSGIFHGQEQKSIATYEAWVLVKPRGTGTRNVPVLLNPYRVNETSTETFLFDFCHTPEVPHYISCHSQHQDAYKLTRLPSSILSMIVN